MDDLVQFLRDRLDEDERIARAASGEEWGAVLPTQPYVISDVAAHKANKTLAAGGRIAAVERAEDREHIARHDPARVLRDIEAMRTIVDQYAEVAANDVDDVEYAHGWANALGVVVRQLATVYADHPSYREEWRL